MAYTAYEFRLVAENSNGITWSDWIAATTRQDSKLPLLLLVHVLSHMYNRLCFNLVVNRVLLLEVI